MQFTNFPCFCFPSRFNSQEVWRLLILYVTILLKIRTFISVLPFDVFFWNPLLNSVKTLISFLFLRRELSILFHFSVHVLSLQPLSLLINLTLKISCIAIIFAEYNKKLCEVFQFIYFCKMLYMFQTVFFRPSSGTQNCTYRVRYLSDRYLTLYVQFWGPDDGREKPRLKRVERITEMNKLRNVASCRL
jgi:hypothetical protein